MKRSRDPNSPNIPCPECSSGMMHLHYLTYFTWMSEELVSVPNFPAWVCDVCHWYEYDPRAIKWLKTLLAADGSRKVRRLRNLTPRHDRVRARHYSQK